MASYADPGGVATVNASRGNTALPGHRRIGLATAINCISRHPGRMMQRWFIIVHHCPPAEVLNPARCTMFVALHEEAVKRVEAFCKAQEAEDEGLIRNSRLCRTGVQLASTIPELVIYDVFTSVVSVPNLRAGMPEDPRADPKIHMI